MFVYIVRCADNSLYTGVALNIEKRLKEHNGELPGGAKYTAARSPVELVYSEEFPTRSAAQKREYEIKQLSRAAKEKLISTRQ